MINPPLGFERAGRVCNLLCFVRAHARQGFVRDAQSHEEISFESQSFGERRVDRIPDETLDIAERFRSVRAEPLCNLHRAIDGLAAYGFVNKVILFGLVRIERSPHIGPSGLPVLMDTFVRLTKVPVVSLAKIRGCVRGVSSEFVLACDMRFASLENTKLGHPELGVGLHPGGGGTERLPHLVGRGRALEIVLSAKDFDGGTAERYGYVNRSLPDVELDGFVDALARRIASFDRRALAAAKTSR
jgi:hypothetical protein